jgi:hypothetical protein
MAFKWRKWNRAVHRDFGYLFFGMTLIYALSGIALNHLDDWNPNYIVQRQETHVQLNDKKPDKAAVISMLKTIDDDIKYKKHYFPSKGIMKVFIKNGTVLVNLNTGDALLERTKRRPLFREVNYLHYNPVKYWTWFSDIFAGALIILGVSGILIPRGNKGITKRGAWLTLLGIVIPLIYLFIYFY